MIHPLIKLKNSIRLTYITKFNFSDSQNQPYLTFSSETNQHKSRNQLFNNNDNAN